MLSWYSELIQQRDWLPKQRTLSPTNHVAEFLFSLRVARTNLPSGKRALVIKSPWHGKYPGYEVVIIAIKNVNISTTEAESIVNPTQNQITLYHK